MNVRTKLTLLFAGLLVAVVGVGVGDEKDIRISVVPVDAMQIEMALGGEIFRCDCAPLQ